MDKFENGLIDIVFSGDKAVLTKTNNISLQEFENQLANQIYNGEGLIVDEIVENSKLPSWAAVFYGLILTRNSLPTASNFSLSYLKKYFDFNEEQRLVRLKSNKEVVLKRDGVEARLLRSYPSLVRDFHFYLMCSRSNYFDEVSYSLKEDYFEGIDIKIVHGAKQFSVSLLTDTKRGNSFKSKKVNRHDVPPVNEIIIRFKLHEKATRKVVSNFFLYSEKHLEDLKIKIHNG